MIRGCYGRGGSGKSTYTVSMLHDLFKRGRDIVSNTPLIDLRVRRIVAPNGKTMWVPVDARTFGHSWAAGYITKFEHIYSLDNCEVFIDEIGTWMPAMKHASIPDEVRQFLAQDRREGVNIWWTHRSTRIFIDVRENTAELAKCARYGPLIVIRLGDPAEPAEKPVYKFRLVKPEIFDLYDTFARVGSAQTGEGYGQGKRQVYGGVGSSWYWCASLPTIGGGAPLEAKIRLREEQAECLQRKFGGEALGLRWEDNGMQLRLTRHAPQSAAYVRLADDREIYEGF